MNWRVGPNTRGHINCEMLDMSNCFISSQFTYKKLLHSHIVGKNEKKGLTTNYIYAIVWLVFTWSPYHWSLVEITPVLTTCTTFIFHDSSSQWVMALLGTPIVTSQWIMTLLCIHNMVSQKIMTFLGTSLLCITTSNYDIAVSPVKTLKLYT